LAEVFEQRAALQAAGGGGREETFDPSLAVLGLAAERELSVDDRAAQRALGVIVGRLDAAPVGERPQRGPDLQQVARQPAGAFVARRLAVYLGRRRLGQSPFAAVSGQTDLVAVRLPRQLFLDLRHGTTLRIRDIAVAQSRTVRYVVLDYANPSVM